MSVFYGSFNAILGPFLTLMGPQYASERAPLYWSRDHSSRGRSFSRARARARSLSLAPSFTSGRSLLTP